MMGWRSKLKGGAEWDAFSKWRQMLCYLARPGVARQIKKKHNRRERREERERMDKILREGER